MRIIYIDHVLSSVDGERLAMRIAPHLEVFTDDIRTLPDSYIRVVKGESWASVPWKHLYDAVRFASLYFDGFAFNNEWSDRYRKAEFEEAADRHGLKVAVVDDEPVVSGMMKIVTVSVDPEKYTVFLSGDMGELKLYVGKDASKVFASRLYESVSVTIRPKE